MLFPRAKLALLWSACILGTLSATGCHSSAAARAFSPLIGAWHINGDAPPADAAMPRFTALVFRRNGNLEASYVAAGGALAGLVKTAGKTGEEHDSYTLEGRHALKIIEGSRALEYSYEVRDDKLFLRSSAGDAPAVFVRVSDDESGVSGNAHAPGDTPADGTNTDNQ